MPKRRTQTWHVGLAEDQCLGEIHPMSLSPDTDSLLFEELPQSPDLSIENRFHKAGKLRVAGIDEAGRGPLAGPVVAAAVILDQNHLPAGLNDSKKLTEFQREGLFDQILHSSHVAWASLPAATIDLVNIREASLLAMTHAANRLACRADHLLIDGRDVPVNLVQRGSAYVKGDSRSLTIAAASIVAKVIRDRMMINAHSLFPEYGFDRHKGYGTRDHLAALKKIGPCALHRRSFSPVGKMINSAD